MSEAKTGASDAVASFIEAENLRPWLELVGQVAGHDFQEEDWDAVRFGIRDTDGERDRWYDYPLGQEGATVAVAAEPEAGLILVRLEGFPAEAQGALEIAISAAQDYALRPLGTR